jgi:type IV pilus assembly protein PilM
MRVSLDRLLDLFQDPAPAYVFEITQAGIAWAHKNGAWETGFRPIPAGALAVSPVKDNVVEPEALVREIEAAAPGNGSKRRREAALILPDYSTRVAVLEFESFPSDRAEQLALVRFRMKKTVPFDLDTASISFHSRNWGKKHEVIVAAVPFEIVARYEALLRAAGFSAGFVTTSMLSAMDLVANEGLVIAAKLSRRILTVTVSESARLRLLRCVELAEPSLEEIMAVLFPTVAYAEDELPSRPNKLLICGFDGLAQPLAGTCRAELGMEVEPLRSAWGTPDATNAGLHGYLQAHGGRP